MVETYQRMWLTYKLQISDLVEADCEYLNNKPLEDFLTNDIEQIRHTMHTSSNNDVLSNRMALNKRIQKTRLHINALLIIDNLSGTQTTNNLSSIYPEVFESIGISDKAFDINKMPIYYYMQLTTYQEKWKKLRNIYQEMAETFDSRKVIGAMFESYSNDETAEEDFIRQQIIEMNDIELKYVNNGGL